MIKRFLQTFLSIAALMTVVAFGFSIWLVATGVWRWPIQGQDLMGMVEMLMKGFAAASLVALVTSLGGPRSKT